MKRIMTKEKWRSGLKEIPENPPRPKRCKGCKGSGEIRYFVTLISACLYLKCPMCHGFGEVPQ